MGGCPTRNAFTKMGHGGVRAIRLGADTDVRVSSIDFRWQPVARLTLNAGVRAEDNASFGTRTVPRAGATYLLRERGGNFGATRLHGFYGQGIDELKWALAKRVQPVEVTA